MVDAPWHVRSRRSGAGKLSDFCVGTESCENLCDFFIGNSQTVSGFLVVSRHNVQLLGISHVW